MDKSISELNNTANLIFEDILHNIDVKGADIYHTIDNSIVKLIFAVNAKREIDEVVIYIQYKFNSEEIYPKFEFFDNISDELKDRFVKITNKYI